MTVAIDPDAPWWANLLVVLLSAIIIAGGAAWGLWFSQRGTKRDVADIKDQVKNTHKTNLREDMDELRRDVRAVHTELREQRDETREDRADLSSLRRDFNTHVRSAKEK